jgi:Carboxypeptidase regulatory-like domain
VEVLAQQKFMKYFSRILLFLVALIAGCSKPQSPPAIGSGSQGKAQPAAVAPHVDSAMLGAVSGVVSFKGAVPKLPPLDMTQDPACPSDPQTSDAIVVRNGKLANVFVYVKNGSGIEWNSEASAKPVVLDQKGCRYVPHVLGLVTGQPLKVLNDDNALHNIHPMPKANNEWNESQMPRGQPIVKSFSHPELMMPVECNQHPWMKSYVNVMEHPFFAVTDEDGAFQIRNLPPGEYTLVAIHEKFGEQSVQITVPPKQAARAEFVFTADHK